MKSQTVKILKLASVLPAVVIAAVLIIPAAGQLQAGLATKAHEPNPRIAPPNSHPNGHTYGEWSALWWQWALSIPEAQNPIADTTGQFAGVGQHGPVWFLGGTFGDSEERSVAVPQGKHLFMPVFQWIFGEFDGDCSDGDCNVDVLRASAAAATESATVLDVRIDGAAIRNVRSYRAISPQPFNVTVPEGAVFGLPSGTFFPQVADGYWLMLEPLSKGKHEIRVHVESSGGANFTVVVHLRVK